LRRAVLISAGRGTRLGALTNSTPKCLTRAGGRTILDHQLEALWANGVDDIHVVVGFQHEAIARHVAQLRTPARPKLILNPFWSVSSSIGSVWAARHVLGAPFCLVNGDTIFDAELLQSVLARARYGLNLVVDKGPLEHDDMRVEAEGGQIRAVAKDLPEKPGMLRSLGMILSTAEDGGAYAGALERIIMRENGRLSYHHDIIDMLAREDAVYALPIEGGRWREIDRPEDIQRYEDAEEFGKTEA